MKTIITQAILILAILLVVETNAKVRVVASTTDLASITELVGGDNVNVESLVRGGQDPHFVELLPSHMLKVARADVYLMVGLDLDYWAPQIIDGSGNGKLVIVDCSQSVTPLQVPTTRVDASMGDIHLRGNPHYWLDPDNGLAIAHTIAAALKRVDPKNVEAYDAGVQRFADRLDAKKREWQPIADRIKGKEIIAYHNSWPYFSNAFGVEIVGFIEPKPGIAPSPSHTAQLIAMAQERNIRVIGREPYFSDRTPKAIARDTGSTVVKMSTSVGGVKAAKDYFSLFDALLALLDAELSN
jgi:ABC-type Zn uptake system ZnuABC Zn-binding protein ZnuA